MPVSKKRKKKGKTVKAGAKISVANRLSPLTLQDLINVVAYQEKHGNFPDVTKTDRNELMETAYSQENKDAKN